MYLIVMIPNCTHLADSFFMTWINFTLLIKKKKKKFQIDLIRRISGSTEFHFCGV